MVTICSAKLSPIEVLTLNSNLIWQPRGRDRLVTEAYRSVRLSIPWRERQYKPFITHISSSVSKENNSPTPSSLRIVSKPNTATREYRKKVHSLQNTCNVDSCTHWVPIFLNQFTMMNTTTFKEVFTASIEVCNFVCHFCFEFSFFFRE